MARFIGSDKNIGISLMEYGFVYDTQQSVLWGCSPLYVGSTFCKYEDVFSKTYMSIAEFNVILEDGYNYEAARWGPYDELPMGLKRAIGKWIDEDCDC